MTTHHHLSSLCIDPICITSVLIDEKVAGAAIRLDYCNLKLFGVQVFI